MNTPILILAMAFAALLGSIGQIFLKLGSGKPLTGMFNYLLAFAALYGVAVLINLWAYRVGGKVSILYPVISLSYIFTAFLAWKVLGEELSTYTVVGTMIIMIGVGLIGFGAS